MIGCRNHTLLVAAVNYSFFELANVSNVLVGVKGRDFKILQVLSFKMQFQYTLVTPVDNQWGNCDDNGRCDGMVGMVARHEADMAISDISYTSLRAKYIDYSYPYFQEEVTFVTKNTGAYQEVNSVFFADPFERQVWIFVAFCLMVLSSVVKILEYLLRTKIMGLQTILQIILRQCVNLRRNENTLSVVMSMLVLVVMAGCICKLYECMLTSSTTSTTVIRPIDTISDMVDAIRNKDYVISPWYGSAFYNIIMTSEVEYMKIFAQSTLKRNFVAPKTNEECMRMMLHENFALITSRFDIKRIWIEMNLGIPLDAVHCGQDTLFIDHVAVALRKNLPCRDDLNKCLNVLIGSGLIDKWHSEEVTAYNQSTSSNTDVRAGSYIVMGDLKLIFVTLLCGYLSGIVSLLMEIAGSKVKVLKIT